MKHKKRMIPLLCALLFLTACGNAAGTNMLTPTPELTKEPEETLMPTPAVEPKPTTALTPSIEPTAVPEPTNPPVTQKPLADMPGKMTMDTYPKVDGSTATLPLSMAVFMAATGESAEVACFYNVTLNHGIQGIYTNRYLPVGQIRQNAEGEQAVRYGTFDLEQGEYAVLPTYSSLEVLDVERGYYVVPVPGGDWMDYQVVNGTGETLLPKVCVEDFMMIWKFGNGYQEMRFDYQHEGSGIIYNYYDENLKLKYVYSEDAAALPDDDKMAEGVEYILMDAGGCLVDADGRVVLNSGIFLDLYGDGETMDCSFQLFRPTLVEEDKLYAVKYCNQIILLDSRLNAVRPVFDEEILAGFEGAEFYEGYCYYYSSTEGEWVLRTYEGQPLLTSYGMVPDYIDKPWGTDARMMYWQVDKQLFVEEYTKDGELLRYTLTLQEDTVDFALYYTYDGYLVLNEYSGELMQGPYDIEQIPKQEISLFYQGALVGVRTGMEGADVYSLVGEKNVLWTVRNGEVLETPSESLLEEYSYRYALADYTFLDGENILYEKNNAFLMFQGNGVAFFIQGNYTCAVGCDGTEYIRALHTFMSTD